jgi:hypothetical protein
MERRAKLTHGLRTVLIILVLFFGASCVVAEEVLLSEFRIVIDGKILSQAESQTAFKSPQPGNLMDRVIAANLANKPNLILRALLLENSQITSIELRYELDAAMAKLRGHDTEEVRTWAEHHLPNSGVFGDQYDLAGVTFTPDQVPVFLDYYGDAHNFSISMDVVDSTATWRQSSLVPLTNAICLATGTNGIYAMDLIAAVHYGSASLSRIPIAAIKWQCMPSPTNSIARRMRLELQYTFDATAEVIECEQFNCGEWSAGKK